MVIQDSQIKNNGVFTFERNTASVPNNSLNRDSADDFQQRQRSKCQDQKKCSKGFEPCCCGGELRHWAFIVGGYELTAWLGMIAFRTMQPYFKGFEETRAPTTESAAQLMNAIDLTEIIAFGFGAMCGVCIVMAAVLRNSVLCLIHMGMTSLLAVALLALIVLNIKFNERFLKWNLVLAYFGFLILQVYFSFFSYGLRHVYHGDTGRTSRGGKSSVSGALNRSFRHHQVIPEIIVTDYDE